MAHQGMAALSQRKHASTWTFIDNCGDMITDKEYALFNNLGVIEWVTPDHGY
jgi:hypothetical protein